jgi:2,4-dienoyl-CoA reductase-like NADH-dependent reductase (Old Yellow Enzyme family)
MFRGDSPAKFMAERQKNPIAKLFLRYFVQYQFPPMPYEELYLLEMAKKIRAAVNCAIVYLGGVSSVASMEAAMREGFDFVGMGRALINDPQMINRIRENKNYKNGCTHCNKCIALIYDPKGVHCIFNA